MLAGISGTFELHPCTVHRRAQTAGAVETGKPIELLRTPDSVHAYRLGLPPEEQATLMHH